MVFTKAKSKKNHNVEVFVYWLNILPWLHIIEVAGNSKETMAFP